MPTRPARPATAAELIEALRYTVPPDEIDRFLDASDLGASRLLDFLAHQQAALAESIYQRQQANFLRSHSSAGREPASGWRHAQGLVRLRRTLDLHVPAFVNAGAMVLDGPGGRRYLNYSSIYFDQFDGAARDVLFVCEVPGTIGNLDALADPDGLLTDEGIGDAPNTPAVLAHANLSGDRANTGGTITTDADPLVPSIIRDSGYPDQFLPQHAGLYVEIVDSDQPANIGRRLRILAHRSPLVELPAGSGLYPTEIAVDDTPAQLYAKAVKVDDGGVFTDYTAASRDDIADDVPLFPDPATVADAIYIGAGQTFSGVAVAVTTAAVGTYTIRWQYWDGGAWVTFVPADDPLLAWSIADEGQIRWDIASLVGWSQNTVDGVTAFWVRVVVATVTLVTTTPLAAKLQCIFPAKLTAGTCHWKVLDWRALGYEIQRIEVMTGGRDAVLDMIAEERGATGRQSFEDDETLRDRIAELADVVSPNAIKRAVARALEPYGMEGLAIDAANGFDGLFIDVDALDYYSPGDLFPENPWKVYTTKSEAFGWFWIILPCLSDGEFGTSYDEGPTLYLQPKEIYLGPAYEYGIYDGFPANANAVYASIYETVDKIRAAGIGFTMLRSCDLNLKKC